MDCGAKVRGWKLAALALLLIAGGALYWPGLAGGFVFDDFPNLTPLGFLSASPGWSEVAGFVFSNNAGITGRPVAMLTFLLQASAWPNNPGIFKAVNLVLHLLNTVLVAWLFAWIARLQGFPSKHTCLIGGAVGALYLMHPMQVSSVLFVIQRMALLSAFFSLVAMLGYLAGRSLLVERPGRGWGLILLSLLFGGGLSVLSKENGFLLPVFILLLEVSLSLPKPPQTSRRLLMVGLSLPLILAGIFVLFHLSSWWNSVASQRDFTLSERLMTEPRVLLDYIATFVSPIPSRLGLFHDDYVISRGLLDPVFTLPAIVLVLCLLGYLVSHVGGGGGIVFGLAWFFIGNLLESTVLPLELYFEHRNYLALAGLAYAAVATLIYLVKVQPRYSRLIFGTGVLWLACCVMVTADEVWVWGNPARLAVVWAKEHPNSPRAQGNLAGFLTTQQKYGEAATLYSHMADQYSRQRASSYLEWLRLGCFDSAIPGPEEGKLLVALRTSPADLGVFSAFRGMVEDVEAGRCQHSGQTRVLRLVDAVAANPNYQHRLQPLQGLRGRFQLAYGDIAGGLESTRLAFDMFPNPEGAILWLGAAARAGNAAEAMRACSEGLHLAKDIPMPGQQALAAACANLAVSIEK